MSASQIRSQLERKRAQQAEAEKKAGEFRSRESKKRAEAAKAQAAAARATNASSARSKLAESRRREGEAAAAGKDAARWQVKAAGYSNEALRLARSLERAEASEQRAAQTQRDREQRQRDQRHAAERSALTERVASAEANVARLQQHLPAPRPEKLRILLLTSSGEGDLRVGREIRQIRAAVKAAAHRDYVDLDVRSAATPQDLLDGITEFRPHVVHFSGHSDEKFVVFEEDTDDPNSGVAIPAEVFARALRAVDTPPSLVVLNSCRSAAQAERLVAGVVPFAIGMADKIYDDDAIGYAARFYGTIANGQSIEGAHEIARTDLEMRGAEGHLLPTLYAAESYDPRNASLVTGPVEN